MRRLLLPFLWLGKVLHWLRLTVLNLLTLAILILIIAAIVQHFSRPQIHVAKNSVLWVEPQGSLVYSESDAWQDRLLQKIHPTQEHVLLRHLVASIDHAAKDPKIRVLALDLREFRGGSLTQLLDVAHALQRFRAQGKRIYAYAPEYSTGNYVLAAQANQVFLPELGMALITPFSSDSLYFKDLFNKIGVDVYAFRQGKYKSAVEPLTRADMSPAAQEENRAWLATWWQSYSSAVDQGRGLSASTLQDYALHLPELLQKAEGNAAQLALKYKLVTQIGDQEDFRDAISKAVGQKKLRRIGWQRYYASFAAHQPEEHGPEIAVVPIDGMLVPGDMQEPGVVAAEATVRQLDHLRHERDVKAVILQVNSPGGDVNAANAIRRAIERLRKAGKPVVVSMGTLGASGAYWLSTAADRIYAEPTTIAADIGVFVLVPNYTGLMQKLGVGYSGVSSLPHSPSLSPFAPLGKPEQQALQAVVDHLYTHFVGLVAKARHMPFAEAEKDAQGRAWSGVDAKRLGLVDGLGGMTEAEQTVAKLAHLQNGQYHLVYLPRPAGESSFAQIRSWALASLGFSLPQGSAGEALTQAQLLLQYSRPYGIFAYLPVDPRLS